MDRLSGDGKTLRAFGQLKQGPSKTKVLAVSVQSEPQLTAARKGMSSDRDVPFLESIEYCKLLNEYCVDQLASSAA
jgi:hypothetical protein